MVARLSAEEMGGLIDSLSEKFTPLEEITRLKVKYRWRCLTCDYIWGARLQDLVKAKPNGCPHCAGKAPLTLELIQNYLDKIGSRLDSGQVYGNLRTKLKIHCRMGHGYEMRPNDIKKGYGCPICRKEDKCYRKPLTIERVQRDCEDRGFEVRDLSQHRTDLSLILLRCKSGHEFETCHNYIESGRGCPECGGTRRKTLEETLIWIDQNTKFKFITCVGEYQNNKSKMILRCPKGHEFRTSRDLLMSGGGCSFCVNKTEQKVGNILRSLGLLVLSQKEIQVPTSIRKSGKIRVDFYIPELNLVVEYHGYQHYEFPNHCHKTVEAFNHQRLKDIWLRNYCKDNGIRYLEISYKVKNKDLEAFIRDFLERI
jgi:hypothetical protein